MSTQTSKSTGISITDGGKKVPVPAITAPMANGKQGEHLWIEVTYTGGHGYCSCGNFGKYQKYLLVSFPQWQVHRASLSAEQLTKAHDCGCGQVDHDAHYAAAPPVEAGLEAKVREIVLGSLRAHDKPYSADEMVRDLATFIRARDAEQQRVNEAEIFRLTLNHLRFIKAEESNRELVEKLEGTIQTIREFEAHSNESGDPVGGCVKCLRLFDALLKRADELRAVLAARNERGGK